MVVSLWGEDGAIGLTILVVIPVIAVAGIIGINRGYTIQLERWQGFRVGLSEDRLLWWAGGEEHVLRRTRIESAREVRGEGLLVEGGGLAVLIPEEVDGYDALKRSLGAEGAPVSARSGTYSTTVLVLTVVAFGVVMVSESAWLVLPLGGVLVSVLAFAAVTIERSPGTDPRVRRSLVWLALPVLAIVVRMVAAVAGLR